MDVDLIPFPVAPVLPILPTAYDVVEVLSVYVIIVLVHKYDPAATDGIDVAHVPVGMDVPDVLA